MPVIRISLLAGRTAEQKAKIAAAMTNVMVEHAGSTPEHVNIIFEDLPRSDWAIAGKLLGGETSPPPSSKG
jgi:4-oxalocrotonate tautomerase